MQNSLCFIAGLGTGILLCFIALMVFVRNTVRANDKKIQNANEEANKYLAERNEIGRRQCLHLEEIAVYLAHGGKEKDPDSEPKRKKPCYCLGRNTIQEIAEKGELQTDEVDFVAADDLFHKNPYKK